MQETVGMYCSGVLNLMARMDDWGDQAFVLLHCPECWRPLLGGPRNHHTLAGLVSEGVASEAEAGC